MGKYKSLLSNTMIFTISEFASKLLVFFMLPIYTRAMSSEDFGISDFINLFVVLLVPVFTLSIANGALRFALSREEDEKQVFSIGIKVIIVGFGLLLLAYPIFLQIELIKDYLFLFYLTYISTATRNYLNQFATGIKKIKLVGICGVLSTGIVVISNIVLLIVFEMGVKGFLISFILAHIICSIALFVGGDMHRYLSLKRSDKRLKLGMLKYSIPLVPNSLSWWLIDAANRFIITAICGVSQAGLFAAATKVPMMLTTLQSIFNQAWQLSAITEFENEDKAEFFTKMYKLYNLLMLLGCSVLILFVKVISGVLFSSEFYTAWRFIPLLLVSVVFGALSGFLSSLYAASKQTKMLFYTTLVGGIVSVALNFLIVPFKGPMGASIASIVAYIVVWLMLLIDIRRFVKLNISILKDSCCYILIILQAILMIYLTVIFGYFSSIIVILIIMIINLKDLKDLIYLIKSFARNRTKSIVR